MTKAQEVRSRRLEKRQSDIIAQAEKVFDWILDLFDNDTQKGYFGSVSIWLYDDQTIIRTTEIRRHKKLSEYDLISVLFQHDRLTFFSTLKRIIEREDGFKVSLKPDAVIWDSKCILLEVVIE